MGKQGFARQSFSMPPVMLQDLRQEAERRDLSMSQVLRQYLRFGGLGQQRDGLDLRREGSVNDNGSQ